MTIGGWDLRRPLINGDVEKLVQSFAGPGGELKCPLWNIIDCCGGGRVGFVGPGERGRVVKESLHSRVVDAQ